MGLGALYLLHLLAQDYMKIRQPAAKLAKFLLSKRDLDAVESKLSDHVVRVDQQPVFLHHHHMTSSIKSKVQSQTHVSKPITCLLKIYKSLLICIIIVFLHALHAAIMLVQIRVTFLH